MRRASAVRRRCWRVHHRRRPGWCGAHNPRMSERNRVDNPGEGLRGTGAKLRAHRGCSACAGYQCPDKRQQEHHASTTEAKQRDILCPCVSFEYGRQFGRRHGRRLQRHGVQRQQQGTKRLGIVLGEFGEQVPDVLTRLTGGDHRNIPSTSLGWLLSARSARRWSCLTDPTDLPMTLATCSSGRSATMRSSRTSRCSVLSSAKRATVASRSACVRMISSAELVDRPSSFGSYSTVGNRRTRTRC